MYDIAIIGAGPAGASAALFAAKAGKKTVMIDSDKTMTRRAMFWNYYGIPETVGPDLVVVGIQQATKYGTDHVKGTVEDIVKTDSGFRLKTEHEEFEAKYVILATGVATDLIEKIGVETKPATEPRIKTVAVVDPDGRTNIEGIWAAGTVAGISVHAIITAANGANVAINILSEINGERYVDHDIYKPDVK